MKTIISRPFLCGFCKYFNGLSRMLWRCDTFPDGIPKDIANNRVDHTTHYKGDNGIQFEKAEDK